MWKSIPGACDYYRVNENGKIQSRYYGEWRDMKPRLNGNKYVVGLKTESGGNKIIDIARLVFGLFNQQIGQDDGVYFLDGDIANCSASNLILIPSQLAPSNKPKSKTVGIEKVDIFGNVVDRYKSVKEAAIKNHIDIRCIRRRCNNDLKNPFENTGYSFRWVVLE